MYCHNCGKQIADGSHFCSECGAEQIFAVNEEFCEPDFGFRPDPEPPRDMEIPDPAIKIQADGKAEKISGLSIIAFIFSFLGGLGFIGTIIAIIDITRNKERKHGFSVVAIIIGIIMTYCFLPQSFLAENNYSDHVQKSSVSRPENSVVENSQTETSTDKDVSAKSTDIKKHLYSLNDIYTDDNIKISMVETGHADSTMLNEFEPVKDGYKVVYADFNIENVGEDSISVIFTDFSGYADNVFCSQYYELINKTGEVYFSNSLSSGRKCYGTVAFEIPENTKNFEIEYKPNMSKNSVVTFDVPE